MNFKKGFTLLELLVVIAIIGFLSSVVLAAPNDARAKARDSKRISDMRQLMNALELYRTDVGSYPAASFSCVGGQPNGASGNNRENSCSTGLNCSYLVGGVGNSSRPSCR